MKRTSSFPFSVLLLMLSLWPTLLDGKMSSPQGVGGVQVQKSRGTKSTVLKLKHG